MNILQNVTDRAKDLKEEFKNLSDAEALQIAAQIVNTEVLAQAFMVSDSDEYPTAFEAIAICLGYKPQMMTNIPQAIAYISDAIRDKE